MSEEKKVREPGYYWVRATSWVVAEWSLGGQWFFLGLEDYAVDGMIEEVDERRITREPEPKEEDLNTRI